MFPLRILLGAVVFILLLWLLFSGKEPVQANDFYGIMIDAGSTGMWPGLAPFLDRGADGALTGRGAQVPVSMSTTFEATT